MDKRQLNLLLVADNEQDYITTQNLLTKTNAWSAHLERVSSQIALEKVQTGQYDVCLFNVHWHNREVWQKITTIPIILLTESEADEQKLKDGVIDCLVKSQLTAPLLERAIRCAELSGANQKLRQEFSQFQEKIQNLGTPAKQYQLLFDLSIYGMELLDEDGRVVRCNSAYQNMLGRNYDAIIGQPTLAFATEKSQKSFGKKMATLPTHGQIEGEVELVCQDGTTVAVWKQLRAIYETETSEVSKTSEVLQHKIFKGSVSYSRDISERISAIKQLSILARALEQHPYAVVVTDELGDIQYVNFKFTELTGYSYEEVIEQNLRNFNSESLTQEYKELWETVSQGVEWRRDIRSLKKDGTEYWESFTMTPLLNYKGNITNFVVVKEDITAYKEAEADAFQSQHRVGNLMTGYISDLTAANEALQREIAERKRIELELRQSRVRLKAQYKGIPVPTYSWQIAKEGIVLVDYNDAAEKASQGRIIEFLGHTNSDVFKGSAQILADFERCATEKTIVKREAPYRLITTGDTRYWVTTYNYVPPNLIIVHIEDITEHRQIETNLRQKHSQLGEIAKKHASELAKTSEALLQEISKRKHFDEDMATLQTDLQQQLAKVAELTHELDKSKRSWKQEFSERQRVEEVLRHTENMLRASQEQIQELVKEQMIELAKVNEQLREEITLREKEEQELRESRARLKAQYKGSPTPTYAWQRVSKDFVLVDYNDAAETANKGRMVDLMGRTAGEVFKDRPQVLADFGTCFTQQKNVRRESPYQLVMTQENKYYITTYNFVSPNLVIVYIEDITRYKQFEDALQRGEEQIELVCHFSPQFTVIFANGAYCWYFNQDYEKLMGKFIPFVHVDDLDEVEIHLAALGQTQPLGVMECRVIRPDGTLRRQRWLNRAIFDKQGNLIEIRSSLQDIGNGKNEQIEE